MSNTYTGDARAKYLKNLIEAVLKKNETSNRPEIAYRLSHAGTVESGYSPCR